MYNKFENSIREIEESRSQRQNMYDNSQNNNSSNNSTYNNRNNTYQSTNTHLIDLNKMTTDVQSARIFDLDKKFIFRMLTAVQQRARFVASSTKKANFTIEEVLTQGYSQVYEEFIKIFLIAIQNERGVIWKDCPATKILSNIRVCKIEGTSSLYYLTCDYNSELRRQLFVKLFKDAPNILNIYRIFTDLPVFKVTETYVHIVTTFNDLSPHYNVSDQVFHINLFEKIVLEKKVVDHENKLTKSLQHNPDARIDIERFVSHHVDDNIISCLSYSKFQHYFNDLSKVKTFCMTNNQVYLSMLDYTVSTSTTSNESTNNASTGTNENSNNASTISNLVQTPVYLEKKVSCKDNKMITVEIVKIDCPTSQSLDVTRFNDIYSSFKFCVNKDIGKDISTTASKNKESTVNDKESTTISTVNDKESKNDYKESTTISKDKESTIENEQVCILDTYDCVFDFKHLNNINLVNCLPKVLDPNDPTQEHIFKLSHNSMIPIKVGIIIPRLCLASFEHNGQGFKRDHWVSPFMFIVTNKTGVEMSQSILKNIDYNANITSQKISNISSYLSALSVDNRTKESHIDLTLMSLETKEHIITSLIKYILSDKGQGVCCGTFLAILYSYRYKNKVSLEELKKILKTMYPIDDMSLLN
jgi:hypothetical protein